MLTAATVIGQDTDRAFIVITAISAALFALIVFFMLYFVFRYRARPGAEAVDIEGNTTLELSFLGSSVVIVLAMFLWGWDGYRVLRGPAPKGALEVRATGQMWLWRFEYPGGRASTTLVLPHGRAVKMRLESRDVIHSFYIPAFRVKQDAVPGLETGLWFVPGEQGTFDLFCTEYCGTGHAAMITRAVVVGEADFNEWAAGKKEIGDGAGDGGPVSRAQKGRALYESNGCAACHSTDGSAGVGPSFKGIFGRREKVTTDGRDREVVVDEAYIMRSEREPAADVVVGFAPVMPPSPMSDEEIGDLIEYLKTLR